MKLSNLSTIEINPPKTPIASVIWLHGLGASGDDFSSIIPQLKLDNVRFILPNAPMQPVSINNGHIMPSWYDIFGFDEHAAQDVTGLKKSSLSINALIEAEHQHGIAYDKIILGGFSQGGALSLYCGLRFPYKLGGIFALSCYLPVAETIPHEAHPANEKTSIFMAHGLYDDILPLRFAQMSYQQLQAQGYNVYLHTYPMLHSVCFEEMAELRNWMVKQLEL